MKEIDREIYREEVLALLKSERRVDLREMAHEMTERCVEKRFSFRYGRRDISDETAAKCIYVGMSAGIAAPLLTTPGADFDDDRSLAVRAGFSVGR